MATYETVSDAPEVGKWQVTVTSDSDPLDIVSCILVFASAPTDAQIWALAALFGINPAR